MIPVFRAAHRVDPAASLAGHAETVASNSVDHAAVNKVVVAPPAANRVAADSADLVVAAANKVVADLLAAGKASVARKVGKVKGAVDSVVRAAVEVDLPRIHWERPSIPTVTAR